MTQQLTTIDFRTRIQQEYSVTAEQLDKAARVIDLSRNKIFYQIESATTPGQDYHVEFNDERQVLTCTCKAAAAGMTCWHRRVSLASERLHKYEVAQQRRREAEATEREIAEAEALVNGAHEAQKHEASATKRHGAKAYERPAFSLMR